MSTSYSEITTALAFDNMTDERQGLPSASKFEVIALCPGQPALERDLREAGLIVDASPDEYQQRGLRIHAAREFGGDWMLLDDDDKEIYRKGLENEQKEHQRWAAEFSIMCEREHTEQRLWLNWPDGSKATSARLDVIYQAADHTSCLVVEWKSLWCRNLTPAERNYQGAVQAVLCKHHYKATHVRIVFNKAMYGRSDVVDYDEAALERAENMVFDKLWQAQQEGAPTQAGNHCRYCPCKPHCRSAAAYAMLPSVVAGVVAPTKKADVYDMVSRLSPADLAFIQKRSTIIRNILEATTAVLKKLNADDLASFGLMLGEGKNLDPIKDVHGAFNALTGHLPTAAVWACMSISKTALAEQVKLGKGMTDKDAKEWVKNVLYPFIEKKKSEGSIEEI